VDLRQRLLSRYAAFTPFTDAEAWTLFKLAAFGEAIGWTLLITGIVLHDYIWVGNPYSISIAGQLHGILFLIYLTAVLILSPSLRWRSWQTLLAGICSVPPYGTLAFELFAASIRNNTSRYRLLWALRYVQARDKLIGST
jgi:integral membrane protein